MLPASAHASAGAEQAVLAEAKRIVREEEARELAKARRKALKEEKQRLAREERERKAAEQRERDGRERRTADRQRRAMLARIRERGAACGGSILHAVFELVPDPRDPRGVRHSLASILALVTMALACKNETMAEIISWISQAGPEVLAAAGARLLPDGTRVAPSGKTVIRVLSAADPDIVDDAVCQCLAAGELALQAAGPGKEEEPPAGPGEGAEPQATAKAAGEEDEEEEEEPVLRDQVTFDGKYVKGARRKDGTTAIMLHAATPGGVLLACEEIPSKTNEQTRLIPLAEKLNGYYPLKDKVLTADALHTFTPLPELAARPGAGCVLNVKDNQPTIRALLENALWAHAAEHVTEDKGHGRHEKRAHLVMDAPDEVKALFPPAEQVARVVRTRTVTEYLSDGHTRTRVTRTSTEFAYLIITMTARQAAPAHIAAYIRRHWGVENRLHWVLDVTFREDSSQVRTGFQPRLLATLRRLSIGLIHQAGFKKVAATRRAAKDDKDLLLAILRLETA
jgi:predicted transposase YbfD/YdcC